MNKAAAYFKKTLQKKKPPQDVKIVSVKTKSLNVLELIDILARTDIVKNKSQGRRLHKQNVIYLENKPIIEDEIELEKNVFRIGQRRYLKVIVK
ncbi:MAG: hypothetical protein U9O78_01745 [Patescibacteria group bacterium]|nr:hypothetical protein [Patescibacteria group bacterium]